MVRDRPVKGMVSVVPPRAALTRLRVLSPGPCVAGYYCSEGSTSPIAEECGGADKYCPQGSAVPQNVSAGHYSTGGLGPSTRRCVQPGAWGVPR